MIFKFIGMQFEKEEKWKEKLRCHRLEVLNSWLSYIIFLALHGMWSLWDMLDVYMLIADVGVKKFLLFVIDLKYSRFEATGDAWMELDIELAHEYFQRIETS